MIPVVLAEFRRDRVQADNSPCPDTVSIDAYFVRCGCGHTEQMDTVAGIYHECPSCGAEWGAAMADAKRDGEGTQPWVADYSDTNDPDAEREYDGPNDLDYGAVTSHETAVRLYDQQRFLR